MLRRATTRLRPWGVVSCAWALATCGGAEVRGRPVSLVSHDVSIDRALVRAREKVADGDFEAARVMLLEVVERSPRDPLADVARVEAARLEVARGELREAERLLAEVRDGVDPALLMRRSLVRGIVFARRGEVEPGVRALRPLARRMIDRSDAAETDCALAALEGAGGRNAEALLALARVESLAEGGVRWTPTGLACDEAATRGAEVRALLGRVEEPRALADTLDALPSGHSLRVEVARRLRTLAEARNEIPRWLRWLADLPDTEATLRVVRDTQGPPVLRVGVLAPTSGPRAVAGTEVLRAVQIALEDQRAVEMDVEDEGASGEEVAAAFGRLAAVPHAGVIGPTLEAHVGDVTARAEAAGVDVYVLSPAGDGVVGGARVHAAGPTPGMRAAAIAAAVRARGTRVRWVAAPGTERDVFAARVRGLLGLAGVSVVDGGGVGGGGVGELRVVLGPWGLEQRSAMAERARVSPTRWVFDARAGAAGTAGVWVGLVGAEGGALEAFRARYCELTGRVPGELAMLAYDAARELVARVRGGEVVGVLARPWQMRAETTSDGEGGLAVMGRCAER